MDKKHRRIIKRAARKYGISPRTLNAVWGVESGYAKHGRSVSSAGAQGPFQFMPSTARSYGINPHNFKQSAYAAAKYLGSSKRAGKSFGRMLSDYNAGAAGAYQPDYVAAVRAKLDDWQPVNGAKGSRRGRLGERTTRVKRTVIPGIDRSDDRRALLMDYLEHRGEPDALLSVARGLREAKDTPRRVKTTRQTTGPQNGPQAPSDGKQGRAEGETVGTLKQLVERASRMNAKHMPYVWGGGHGNPKAVGPWDCSGAISRLFRINPRVSGQFASWGKPGKGKHVTVYANSGHVFVEINGRFFGTSRSNPGGGAGWIPASQMSQSYLSQFTKRHPNGL